LYEVHVNNSSQKIDKNIGGSFSSTFLFYRISGCFSAMGVQKHYKKRFTQKSCRKAFTKKTTKQSQTDFREKNSIFFGTFWAFLGEGSSKTRQKYRKKSGPGRFLVSDPPTPRGSPISFFSFAGPLDLKKTAPLRLLRRLLVAWRLARSERKEGKGKGEERLANNGQFKSKGRQRKRKLKATYIWQMATKWGR
jgi:hypothetical protein